MKKIIVLIMALFALFACDDGSISSSYTTPEEQQSILEFKGLHPQDSGVNIEHVTLNMGKRMCMLWYNKEFTLFDSMVQDDYQSDAFKYLYQKYDYNIKLLATAEDNYQTSIILMEVDEASRTKKALFDKKIFDELKEEVDETIQYLGFNIQYSFRTYVQGVNSILFKIYNKTTNTYGYIVLIPEDDEKQTFIWAMTNDSDKIVKLEKNISSIVFE